MGRRAITAELYAAMLDGFREHPGNALQAQNLIRDDPRCEGTPPSRRTLKKAWVEGWPKFDLDPISVVIDRETLAARTALALERGDDVAAVAAAASDETLLREKARLDAITARAEEGRLVRAARKNVVALLESSRDLLEGYRKLAPKLRKKLAELDVDDMNPDEAARLLWRIAIAARASTESGMKVLQMERLLLGQPMEIIGVKELDDLTEDDALEELAKAAEMAERVRERRARRGDRLRLLKGGKADKKSNGSAS